MGHLPEVDANRLAINVASDRNSKWAYGTSRFGSEEHVANGNELTLLIGYLDPNGGLARNGRKDPNISGGHGVCDVLVQRRDLGDLHAGTELEFVAGHCWPHGHTDQTSFYSMSGERFFEHPTLSFHCALIDFHRLPFFQQGTGRQLPHHRRRFFRPQSRQGNSCDGGLLVSPDRLWRQRDFHRFRLGRSD